MSPAPGTVSPLVRRPAADLTEAVVENMRRNLEVLRYSVLAPGRYTVYLHPDEVARLEGIMPVLCEQTQRALGEELARLNSSSGLRRYVRRLFGRARPPIENAGGEWHVEFLADPDGEVGPGDIIVDSELVLPARPELGVGERTRRITTVHNATRGIGQRETTRMASAAASSVAAPSVSAPSAATLPAPSLPPPDLTRGGVPAASGVLAPSADMSQATAAPPSARAGHHAAVLQTTAPHAATSHAATSHVAASHVAASHTAVSHSGVIHSAASHSGASHPTAAAAAPATGALVARARLSFEDESGRRSYDVLKDTVTIGRGGTAYPVDVRIASSPDVSREHARLRRDPQSGRFFLIDLSSLGTTVNGRRMPAGVDEVEGRKRENGIEVPLEDGSRIGLADIVFLDFRIVP